jgi:Ca2+-binding EF-hand superfamily protein
MPPKTTPAPVASQVPATKSFDASKYVNKNMDIEDVNKLKEVFDLFDYDHSGQISIEEIQDTIKALGL